MLLQLNTQRQRAPAAHCAPCLGSPATSQDPVKNLNDNLQHKRQQTAHRPILDPLVLDAPNEPRPRCLACAELGWIGGRSDGVSNDGALVCQRAQLRVVTGPAEEDKGPALKWGLSPRGRAERACKRRTRSRLGGAYTTRWRFERRIPPLKSASASPTLQIAWPGMGCAVQDKSTDLSCNEYGTYLDVKPLLCSRWIYLQSSESVVKE